MCSGCSVNKLALLPKSEQILMPNLFNLLVVLAYHADKSDYQETIKQHLIDFIGIVRKILQISYPEDSVLSNIFLIDRQAASDKSSTELVKSLQSAYHKLKGVTTAPIENFLHNISDIRLWSLPCWVVIHWSSLRIDVDTFTQLISLLPSVLPCSKCAGHTRQYLKDHPPLSATDGDLFAWSMIYKAATTKSAVSDVEYWRQFYRAMPT